jgi:hypothetical protein
MRIARKLFLLALTAIAAMAFAASAASAQGPVEVVVEGGQHCPPVLGPDSGGCIVHFGNEAGGDEVSLVGHVFGIEATASDCLVELEARIDEDGEGYVYAANYHGDAAHGCTRTPCGLPWRIHGEEDEPLGSGERIHAEFCAHPTSGSDNRCLVEAPIVDSGGHNYEIPLADQPGTTHLGAECELTSGELHLEVATPHQDIEIIHTTP